MKFGDVLDALPPYSRFGTALVCWMTKPGGSQPSPGIVSRSFFTAQWRLALCTASCFVWAQIRWRSCES